MTLNELYRQLANLIIQGYGGKEVMIYDETGTPFSITGVEIIDIEPGETAAAIIKGSPY